MLWARTMGGGGAPVCRWITVGGVPVGIFLLPARVGNGDPTIVVGGGLLQSRFVNQGKYAHARGRREGAPLKWRVSSVAWDLCVYFGVFEKAFLWQNTRWAYA